MTTPRAYDTATLLPNGLVLVAGGDHVGGSIDLASAELYDPATGTFTPTGSMTYAAEQQSATLLRTGQVLIAGGASSYNALTAADLYNPASGTFTPTGSMTTYRAGHTATLLANGQVLLTGGCSGLFFACVSTWASAELYNPTTGTFTTTGSMSTARQFHTATLLRNGLVLVAGGATCPACATLASAELYSPLTGRWYRTGSMHLPRAYASATLLPNGDVLVAGGCTVVAGNCQAYSTLRSAEVYHPATGRWYWVGPMTVPRADQTATLLPSGQVLLAGGENGTGIEGGPLASAELYTPWTGSFTATATMNAGRDIHTATLLPSGQVLVAGGCSSVGMTCVPPITASAEVYTLGAGSTAPTPEGATRAGRVMTKAPVTARPIFAPAGWSPSD